MNEPVKRTPPQTQGVFRWERLKQVTPEDPLRVLSRACLLGHRVSWDDQAYTSSNAMAMLRSPKVQLVHYCSEDPILGTPPPLTTLHGDDGFDVLDGRATVQDTLDRDHTEKFIQAAHLMLALARQHRIELALLMETSDSCGSTAIYLGDPAKKPFQDGPGVSAALLMRSEVVHLLQFEADCFFARLRMVALLSHAVCSCDDKGTDPSC